MKNRAKIIISVIVGLVLGFVLIVILHTIFFQPPAMSGCPTDHDNSTDVAQVVLLGTVGGAYTDANRDCWREDFVQPLLEELGVTYFNPVVENWTEESAAVEARVIAQAETLVLVITENHPSIGSLSESGWVILSALERDQNVIIYIAPHQNNEDSWRGRQIVLSQARPLAERLDRVTLVDNFAAVLEAINTQYK